MFAPTSKKFGTIPHNPNTYLKWNFANPGWHRPTAANDLQIGGRYETGMKARDRSLGSDFVAVYKEINHGERFTYEFGAQPAIVEFNEVNGQTEVTITFDPETEDPVELQRNGWEALLNNFKKYTETNK